MNINPELVARAYAIYEFYFGLTEEVSSSGSSNPAPSPSSISEDDLKSFIEQLKALNEDEDEGGAGSQKGLRGDEQLREARALTMGRPGR